MFDSPQSTTPTKIRQHGSRTARGLETTPSSSTRTGRFGRMFRHVPVFEHEPKALIALGNTMIQPFERPEDESESATAGAGVASRAGSDDSLALDKPLQEPGKDDDENADPLADGEQRLPAGYTYLGQFVDHDITFDPVSSLDAPERSERPDQLPHASLRSRLALRSRARQSAVSLRGGEQRRQRRDRLLLGTTSEDADEHRPAAQREGRALIGDPRNDENVIISQLQVAFIKIPQRGRRQLARRRAQRSQPFQASPADRALALPVGRDPRLSPPACRRRRVRRERQAQQEPRRRRRSRRGEIRESWERHTDDPETEPALLRLARSSRSCRSSSRWRRTGTATRWRDRLYPIKDGLSGPKSVPVEVERDGKTVVEDITVERIPLFPLNRDGDLGEKGGPLNSLSGFDRPREDVRVNWKYFLDDIDGTHEFLPQPSYKIDTTLGRPLGMLPPRGAARIVVRQPRLGSTVARRPEPPARPSTRNPERPSGRESDGHPDGTSPGSGGQS